MIDVFSTSCACRAAVMARRQCYVVAVDTPGSMTARRCIFVMIRRPTVPFPAQATTDTTPERHHRINAAVAVRNPVSSRFLTLRVIW